MANNTDIDKWGCTVILCIVILVFLLAGYISYEEYHLSD